MKNKTIQISYLDPSFDFCLNMTTSIIEDNNNLLTPRKIKANKC